MRPLYKFYLRKGSATATATEVHPVWKDDLSLEYSRESQQMFMRTALSGSVDFLRGEYDAIMAEPFGTVFYFEIQISDGGQSWSRYWFGKFTITDCKVNVDDKRITVKPQVVDQYNDILAGLEKEYDLIKLCPVTEQINVCKRPAIQILNMVSRKVTVLYGNMSFEQDANLPEENPSRFVVMNCHFAAVSSTVYIQITDPPSGYETAFADPFVGTLNGDGSILTNTDNSFYMEYNEAYDPIIGYINSLSLVNRQQGDARWIWRQINRGTYAPIPSNILFAAQTSLVTDMNATTTDMGTYSRLILNADTYEGEDTFPIYADDITYNRNYKRVYPYVVPSDMFASTNSYSSTPTEWGSVEGTAYYYQPPDNTPDKYIPFGRDVWGAYSYWIVRNNDYLDIEDHARSYYKLKDAYPLWSCIGVLLAEIAPNVTFGNTSSYSQFLYSGGDPVGHQDNRLYITPKSNITAGEYQTPAQTAPVTLKQLLDMLRNVYRCYWFVDNSNRLRIEHIKFFMNGGSYSSSPSVGIDLTSLINPRNGKTWAYATNEYEFDKIEMPERYEFAWMDEVTQPFKGNPIRVVSSYVEQGKIEEITVNNFTSDIDYMLLNPNAVSPDGFALMQVDDSYDGLYMQFIIFGTTGVSYMVQNGLLAFYQLQNPYWLYDMPSSQVIVNDETESVIMIQKGKKQTVNVPCGVTDPDVQALIKTGIGNGEVRQMSIRLTTRMAKTELRYDTE